MTWTIGTFVAAAFALVTVAAAEDFPMSEAPPPKQATDDAPLRTHSGKVAASTDPRLAPAYGPNPAKVVVEIFSDFQCPVCRRITDATHQIPEEWPGEVRVEFRQLPLPIHQNARRAALAALAAHRQGKFWEMHDLLFENQEALDEQSLAAYAATAGCDLVQWRRDFADPTLAKRVDDEVALAGKLGAVGTPAFLVNGKLSVGWASWTGFRGLVAQEREAANALIAKGTKPAAVHAARARANLTDDAAFKAYKAAVIYPLDRAAAGSPAPKPAAKRRR